MGCKTYGLIKTTFIHETDNALLLELPSGVRRWFPLSTVRRITKKQVPLATEVEVETWFLEKQIPPIRYIALEH